MKFSAKEQLSLKDIKLEIPYKIKTITDLYIHSAVNEHGKLTLKGILEETTNDDVIIGAKLRDRVNISYLTPEGGNNPIFTGIVTEASLTNVNRVKYIEVEAMTDTFLMDIKKKNRSFQNKENTYKNIFEKITKGEYGGDYIDELTKGSAQNRTIIQYNETDWEFIKRLASHFKGIIVSDIIGTSPKLWIGLPQGENYEEKEAFYITKKSIKDYAYFNFNMAPQWQPDHIIYEVESAKIYAVGDKIIYNEVEFVVSEIEVKMDKALIKTINKIQKANGIKQNIIYNPHLRGISLDGRIINVAGDRLKLHLDIDQEQKEPEANWYQFNAQYTTEGTTGWYTMPQVGDNAKLYLPDEEEDHGFVRTVNRKDGGSNKHTGSPKTKYMGTINNKQIKMDEKEIKIKAKEEKDGKMFMSLNEDSGVTIESDKKIEILSSSEIIFTAKTISIDSKEEIIQEVEFSKGLLKNETKFTSPIITMRKSGG